MIFEDEAYLEAGDWQFVPTLSTDDVWDAFVIVALLKDKERRNYVLQVPHDGSQKGRFTAAMEERNKDIIHNGQPDAVRHICDKCYREYMTVDGQIGVSFFPS